MSTTSTDVYSLAEIAEAAGVPEEQVLAYLEALDASPGAAKGPRSRPRSQYVLHDVALSAGLALRRAPFRPAPFFTLISAPARTRRPSGVPFALSSTLHAGILAAAMFIGALGLTSSAATVQSSDTAQPLRLVFLAVPGPGGGGGGGGLLHTVAPPKALREGHRAISSPIPPPNPSIESQPDSPAEPPIKAEPFPIVAPVVAAPADPRDRVGVPARTDVEPDSHGPGNGGGTGAGVGTGLGHGDGSGVGPGAEGGTGGGPFRPGSGIEPPKLLHEVRADYTEDARQRGLAGEVVLEIVVLRDGSVGNVKMLQGLEAGLNDRAVQAVRQWRFSPAKRQGIAVDVIVEVAVEFRLR